MTVHSVNDHICNNVEVFSLSVVCKICSKIKLVTFVQTDLKSKIQIYCANLFLPQYIPLIPFFCSSLRLKQCSLPPFFLACIDLLIVLSTKRVAGPGSHPSRVWMVSPLATVWTENSQQDLCCGHPSIQLLSQQRSYESKGNKFNPSRGQKSKVTQKGYREKVCIINQWHSWLYLCISMTLFHFCQSHLHGFLSTKGSHNNRTGERTNKICIVKRLSNLRFQVCYSCTVIFCFTFEGI